MDTKEVKSGWLRKILIGLGVIAGLFALFIYVGVHIPDYVRWKAERDARAYDAALAAEREQLAAMEKADTYGSTTPEGTVELILAALEKGDTELASKYYYVLDQEKAKASFDKQLAEKGNLDTATTFFKDLLRGTKGCNDDGNVCVLEYEVVSKKDSFEILPGNPKPILVPSGSKDVESKTFNRNTYTGIWKAGE